METYNFSPRNFDRKVLRAQKVVGIFEIHGYALAITSHAMKMFRERGDQLAKSKKLSRSQKQTLLSDMFELLKNSDFTKRKLRPLWVSSHIEHKTCYRSTSDWVFVLVWNRDLASWVVKTMYLRVTCRKGEFKIFKFSKPGQIQSWSPGATVVKGRLETLETTLV